MVCKDLLCCAISTRLYVDIKTKTLYLDLEISFNDSLGAMRTYIRIKPVFKFINFFMVCIQIKLYKKTRTFFLLNLLVEVIKNHRLMPNVNQHVQIK